MDLKEAYERVEWQIKHDVDNYDKDPTVAGIIDLERIKEAIDELQAYKDKEKNHKYLLSGELSYSNSVNKQLQAYKDKEDKLREYIDKNYDQYQFPIEGVLQILNEGGKE